MSTMNGCRKANKPSSMSRVMSALKIGNSGFGSKERVTTTILKMPQCLTLGTKELDRSVEPQNWFLSVTVRADHCSHRIGSDVENTFTTLRCVWEEDFKYMHLQSNNTIFLSRTTPVSQSSTFTFFSIPYFVCFMLL